MTPDARAKLIKEPEDHREAVGRLLEAAGGKLHGYWYAFGDHDGCALGEAPDNTAMASALVTVAGSGAFSSLSTAALVTVEEMLDALGRRSASPTVPRRLNRLSSVLGVALGYLAGFPRLLFERLFDLPHVILKQ